MSAHFKKHFFGYVLLLFIFFLVVASYFRFIVEKNYLVAYEGDCNPYTEQCFLYCEDDECYDPFYYTVMERYASEVYETCGTTDVTQCDEAYYCDETTPYCEVYFCDPEYDGEDACEQLTEDDFKEEIINNF